MPSASTASVSPIHRNRGSAQRRQEHRQHQVQRREKEESIEARAAGQALEECPDGFGGLAVNRHLRVVVEPLLLRQFAMGQAESAAP